MKNITFTTSQGSQYQVDKDGKTIRTKLSEGHGKGETDTVPNPVLYVTPDRANDLLENFNSLPIKSLRFGYVKDGSINVCYDPADIPKDEVPLVILFERDTNTPVKAFKAEKEPKIGLNPVEKTYYNDGTAGTHIGNTIVDLKISFFKISTPKKDRGDIEL